MAERRFERKTVLVTGAASGIGRATAERLAGEGAQLALADRDAPGLDAVAAALRSQHGAEARTFVYDAADGDASARMTSDAAEALGGLDCVVCNAGIYRRSHFADISPADWSLLIAVNLTSVARIVQAALPALIESRGNFVATSSTAGIHGVGYAAHYAAAKAGIIALTKSLAAEYASSGVRFNAVAPGRIKTALSAGITPLEGQDKLLLTRPPRLDGRKEGGTPEEVASAIAYLASDDASFVSGSVLVVDGAQNLG